VRGLEELNLLFSRCRHPSDCPSQRPDHTQHAQVHQGSTGHEQAKARLGRREVEAGAVQLQQVTRHNPLKDVAVAELHPRPKPIELGPAYKRSARGIGDFLVEVAYKVNGFDVEHRHDRNGAGNAEQLHALRGQKVRRINKARHHFTFKPLDLHAFVGGSHNVMDPEGLGFATNQTSAV
jgi:hypothetical protein